MGPLVEKKHNAAALMAGAGTRGRVSDHADGHAAELARRSGLYTLDRGACGCSASGGRTRGATTTTMSTPAPLDHIAVSPTAERSKVDSLIIDDGHAP